MLFSTHQNLGDGNADASEELVTEYNLELNELTFNSKPIINNLTIIAEENIHAADKIVAVIENRIRTVDPSIKLPSMYLLDSICKNVGGVYIKLFETNISNTFSAAYRACDTNTRMALVALKKTWLNVFSPVVLQTLDDVIQVHSQQREVQPPPQIVNPIVNTQEDLIQQQITLLLTEIQRQLANPSLSAQERFIYLNILQQLQVTPQNQLVQQLQLLTGLTLPQQPSYPFMNPYPLPQQPSYPILNYPQQTYPQNYYVNQTPVNPEPVQSNPVDTSDILTGLEQYLVKPNARPAPQTKQQNKKQKLSKDLWSSDTLKKRDDAVVEELYTDFPLQCKNCGLRFTERHKMDLHLDWHFVQNRKDREKSRKAVSRSWYQSRDDWVNSAEISEKTSVPFPFGENESEENSEKDQAVPADESQPNCVKCGELFNQYWDSNLQEWMYKDCINVEGIIYHTKCSQLEQVEKKEVNEKKEIIDIKEEPVSYTHLTLPTT
eukprot:TRINITY_DN777_c0_g3_i1.p1 TRINITY_DN777_c0_g3~~TRINITY_DN777_c0_g3_i1.p1  ORF type:complete len:492 (-),score=85.60 TRINITY_DN777_c0_g3_i1:46-1521(-)